MEYNNYYNPYDLPRPAARLVLNWTITPPLPSSYYTHTLAWSDPLPAPNITIVDSTTMTASWNTSGTYLGSPSAVSYVRCVYLGEACSALPVGYEGIASGKQAVSPSPDTFTIRAGTGYTCYTVAVNALGEVCSTTGTDVDLPLVGSTITIGHPNGSPWKVDTGSENKIRLGTGSSVQFTASSSAQTISSKDKYFVLNSTGALGYLDTRGIQNQTHLNATGNRDVFQL